MFFDDFKKHARACFRSAAILLPVTNRGDGETVSHGEFFLRKFQLLAYSFHIHFFRDVHTESFLISLAADKVGRFVQALHDAIEILAHLTFLIYRGDRRLFPR